MKWLYTTDELKAELIDRIKREGGIWRASQSLKISRTSIYHVIQDQGDTGDKMARALGYRRVVRYEKDEKEE